MHKNGVLGLGYLTPFSGDATLRPAPENNVTSLDSSNSKTDLPNSLSSLSHQHQVVLEPPEGGFPHTPISLDSITNNCAANNAPSTTPSTDEGFIPIQHDGVPIPSNCPILLSSELSQIEEKTGIRQKFPRNDFCSKCSLPCPYSDRIKAFQAWLCNCQNQVVVLEYQDDSGNSRIKILPKRVRFTSYYFRKVRSSFFRLISHLISNYSIMFFLTLTVNPSWNLSNDFSQTSKQCHRVIQALRKRLSRQNISMDFIKVFEPTEKGIIHVHLILFLTKFPMKDGKVWLIDKDELDKLWGLGHTWLGWHDVSGRMLWLPLKQNGERNLKKALSYALKYISKSHSNLLFSSLIWNRGKGGGLRSWTFSRRLSSLSSSLAPPRSTSYTVVWLGYVWELPTWALPAEFNGHLVQTLDDLFDKLRQWWLDAG